MRYTPRPQFRKFHDARAAARWRTVVAHRRMGKTVACVNELIEGHKRAALAGKKNPQLAYIAPLLNQARDVAWRYLLQYTEHIPGRKVNNTDLRVDMPGGGWIRLYGAENPDRLRGLYLDGVVLDEIGDISPIAWQDVIRPCLSDRKGWAVFIGTPKGKNMFWEMFKRGTKPDQPANDRYMSWFFPASKTGIIDAEELDSLRESLDEDKYLREFECSFEASLPGAIFGKELTAAKMEGRTGLNLFNPSLKVYTSWDLGFSDSTAVWFWQLPQVGDTSPIHIIDYLEVYGEDIETIARKITGKPYQYGAHWFPHDAKHKNLAGNGRSIVEQMFRNGVKGRVLPNMGVQDTIQGARLLLKRCHFDEKIMPTGFEVLAAYEREFDEDRKIFKNTPLHNWASHGSDAFRMFGAAMSDRRKDEKGRPPRFFKVDGSEDATTFNELLKFTETKAGKMPARI